MDQQDEIVAVIAPRALRYVKLGAGGGWAQTCLAESRLYFGNETDPHASAALGDWDAVRNISEAIGMVPSSATSNTRELKDFYTLGSDCLWITFAQGHMWWGQCDLPVQELPDVTVDGRRHYRNVIGGWRSTDRTGAPLLIDRLSTALTKVASYQRTICTVKEQEYLLRILNAEPNAEVVHARFQQNALAEAMMPLITKLHWADFELFVELLLTRLGWRRIGRLGGIQADIDILLELPATGERMAVQVKSALDATKAAQTRAKLKAGGIAERLLIACHSPSRAIEGDDEVALWDGPALASRAVTEGLTGWLIEHSH